MNPNCVYEFCLFCDVDKPCYNFPIDKQCCAEHQLFVTDANIQKWTSNDKFFAVKIIKNFFDEFNNCAEKENKTTIINKIFVFLVKHKRFIFNHPEFSKTCLNKLYEFQKDPYVQEHPEIFCVKDYIQELYPNLAIEDTVKITDIVFDF
jgi:hypothetical protein